MSQQSIHIIGGGIIGLCSAWYLNKAGYEVTVIDKYNFAEGASHGNAGMIVPSHFIPMAAPGVIRQGLKWILNSKSPFYIKPRFNADLYQWLWHFYKSSTASHVASSISLLYNFHERSKELYKEIAAEESFNFGFKEKGLLMLYRTKRQEKEEEQTALQAQKLGIAATIIDRNSLQELEPDMEFDVRGGLYFPGDAQMQPRRFMGQMTLALKAKGVHFIGQKEIVDFKLRNGKVEGLMDKKGDKLVVKKVLLTSGSWTALLLKKIGVKIHLQAGKGYSMTFEKQNKRPSIPTILSEAKVALTPMGDGLRVAGTLELSGLSNRINHDRVQGIIESIPAYYKNFEIPFSEKTAIWKGYRPCTPDGLPYLGISKSISNLTVGTGHGMMGLSLGAASGKLLNQLIRGEKPMINLSPFRLDRF